MLRNGLIDAVSIGLIAAGISGCSKLPGKKGEPFASAVAVCEGVIVKGLLSPTSYVRVSESDNVVPSLSFTDFTAYLDTKGCPADERLSSACLDTNRFLNTYAAIDGRPRSKAATMRALKRWR